MTFQQFIRANFGTQEKFALAMKISSQTASKYCNNPSTMQIGTVRKIERLTGKSLAGILNLKIEKSCLELE